VCVVYGARQKVAHMHREEVLKKNEISLEDFEWEISSHPGNIMNLINKL
jgi:hypothetical protein